MLPSFFLMLREGLEAALVVGIVAAYLVKIGRRDALPKIALGVVAAVALSAAAGVAVVLTVGRLPLVVQETFEGLAAIAAIVVLTWMLFWMRRQGRSIRGDLERGVDGALSEGGTRALAGLAFIAVIREGLETTLFLLALLSSVGETAPAIAGGILGLAVAVGVGLAIFVGGVRIDLRRFFTVTGVVLIFVAAGLAAFAVAELGEAGHFVNAGTALNLNAILPDSSPFGAVLRGLFGYRSEPTPLELAAWALYLVPVLVLFTVGLRLPRRGLSGLGAGATLALLAGATLVLAGCAGGTTTGSPAGAAADATPRVVEVVATEYHFEPDAITVAAGTMTFRVANRGEIEHEFEIFEGDRVVDEVEGLLPGLSRDLTVTLEPGTYRFVCKMSGHEEAGMVGELVVTD